MPNTVVRFSSRKALFICHCFSGTSYGELFIFVTVFYLALPLDDQRARDMKYENAIPLSSVWFLCGAQNSFIDLKQNSEQNAMFLHTTILARDGVVFHH